MSYEAKAVACGSGQDVTAFVGEGTVPAGLLLITMRPASAHNEAGQLTAVRTLRPALSSLKNVFGTCDFEGVVTYAVAVSGLQPFKVSTLTDPPRLVIDFARVFAGLSADVIAVIVGIALYLVFLFGFHPYVLNLPVVR